MHGLRNIARSPIDDGALVRLTRDKAFVFLFRMGDAKNERDSRPKERAQSDDVGGLRVLHGHKGMETLLMVQKC